MIEETHENAVPQIAVIGLSGRFPGAQTPGALWRNLAQGTASIARFQTKQDEGMVGAGGVLDRIEWFDADFFGFSPREAEVTDPQQRLFLECAWEALESAGLVLETMEEQVGVFAGCDLSTYLFENLLPHRDQLMDLLGPVVLMGNDKDYLCTRVAYKLGLRGPAVTVATACSTSLVAVQTACQSLLSFQCDAALAGGAGIAVPQDAGYRYRQGMINSPSGRVAAFDAEADGTVRGSGVGVVLLKRLEDALDMGDPIHAVIRAAAVNNDGSLKAGFTTPAVEGQAAVVLEALLLADVAPESIGMIEAHGTGTVIGDPIEVTALIQAFDVQTHTPWCALGSVKTNLGHLNAAAGIAGLIKTILALKQKQIPPSLNFQTPNPDLPLESSPFYVNTQLKPWPLTTDENGAPLPRRAGVSSFGIGGTNAHVILEEAPDRYSGPCRAEDHLLVLSAKTPEALEARIHDLIAFVQSRPHLNLADTAYTLQRGRTAFPHRAAFTCSRLAQLTAPEVFELGPLPGATPPVVFVIPDTPPPMQTAAALTASEPIVQEALTQILAILDPHAADSDPLPHFFQSTASPRLAWFAVAYGLAQLWLSHGIQPHALIGDGIGEWVAATLSGAMNLQDAVHALKNRPAHVAAGRHGGDAHAASPRALDQTLPLGPPEIPLISSQTGDWFQPNAPIAFNPTTHGFQTGLQRLAQDRPIFLEIGAGALEEQIRDLFTPTDAPQWESTLPSTLDTTPSRRFHEALGRLWCAGQKVDWAARYHGENRLKLRLPTYPFQRQSYWIDPPTDLRQPLAKVPTPTGCLDPEEVIAGIFKEILAQTDIGPHSDFFDLGGDSLTATMLIARLEELLPVAPTLDDLFDHPTVAELAAVLSERMIQSPAPHHSAPTPRQPHDPTPLSFSQRRLWFLHQLKGGAPAYNLPFALRLEGELSRDALTAAVNAIVRRHEILRTTFAEEDGEPRQVIHAYQPIELEFQDWSANPNSDADWEQPWRDWADHRFNLEHGPLLRTRLIRLNAQTHLFLLNLHHIITDGWSNGVLVDEISQIYRAHLENRPVPLPPPAVQFADVALWRHRLADQHHQRLTQYWRDTLHGMPHFTPIPGDRPRPARQTFNGATHDFTLSPELSQNLNQLARDRDVTLFMCLDACFAILYARYSGHLDFGLGTPYANRGAKALERAVGFFADTLVLRHNLNDPNPDGPNFGQLLQRVRRTVLDAFAHGDLPFEQVVEAVQPPRDQSMSPLFQAMFVLQNTPQHALDLPGLRVTGLESPLVTAKFDLTLSMFEAQNGLIGSIEYNTDLFNPTTIQTLANDFQTLAQTLVDQPNQPIGPLCRNLAPRPHLDTPNTETAAFTPPRTDLETTLARVWMGALGRDQISVHDDFFQIGGHSLLAVRVKVRLEKALNRTVSLNTLFEQRTIAQLASVLENQPAAANEPEVNATHIDPESRYQPFPLTDVQFAYWMGRREDMTGGNVSAHLYMEAEGDLQPERFKTAWRKLTARHDMLRAVILPDGRQQILKNYPPNLTLTDLRRQAPEQREQILQTARAEMSHQVLPTDRPLYQIRLYQLTEQLTRVHFSIDALIVDAMSTLILGHELNAFYNDPNLTLPPLGLSFRDVVITDANYRQSSAYQKDKTYWTQRLEDLPPGPDLPLAKRLDAVTTPRFRGRRAVLPAADWTHLKQRAADHGLTPSVVLLNAFSQILAFWSTSPRFTLNLTTFNRRPIHPDVDHLVGDFTALTLLAVDADPRQNFLDRAKALQTRLLTDLDHGQVNGLEVLRDLRHHRGDRDTLMPVVFTSTLGLDEPEPNQTRDDIVNITYSATQTPQIWLDHNVRESRGELILNWDAVEELFPTNLLDTMFSAYTHLLTTLCAPSTHLTDPNLATTLPTDQALVRARVNATQAPLSQDLLHTAFTTMAEADPHAPAVIASDQALTHGELLNLSQRWAAVLQDHGAGPGQIVAVLMEKGWEQVVAVYAVLLAGAAYLPVDPDLPTERRNYLLDQAQATLVLTLQRLTAKVPAGRTALQVDTVTPPQQSPIPKANPQDVAYIIFTSGSTGFPKGVVITHQAAVNTIRDINTRFQVGADDRVLALSNLNFDLSVYDLFGVLGAGGALVLPDSQSARDPAHWTDLCRRHRVTLWNTVPALKRAFIDYLNDQAAPPELPRLVLLSGDWIPVDLPGQIRRMAPQTRIISLGGATEASIWSNYYPIEEVHAHWTSIPYGRPLTNQNLHILDAALNPRPTWTPGQLYIGGVGLAQGYLNDPAKTQAAFIQHPQTGERLYHTGDLGRYLPDGDIEFLGRADNQVKIRGHRIELGEIEAALVRHPAVTQTLVKASGEKRENQRLVAYIAGPGMDQQAAHLQAQKLDFKLARHGLRPSDPNAPIKPLADPDPTDQALFQQRRSQRTFPKQPVTWQNFSRLFNHLRAQNTVEGAIPKHAYPSAGSLYPVQVYLHLKADAVAGLAAGLYYYDPAQNHLRHLDAEAQLEPDLFAPFNRHILETAGFALYLVGKLDAIAPIYGDSARDFCLLEAGYLGQLLMERATPLQIGLCPVGTLQFESLRSALNLDANHIFLHGFLGGPFAKQTAEPKPPPPPQPPQPPNLEHELTQFLAQQLPAYMIPAAFVFLERLPTTANGKIDHKALPEPTQTQPTALTGPRTPTEKTLAQMWRESLSLDQIGIDQNFFDLGGDSLLLIRLITRMQQTFQRVPNLTTFFKAATIAQTARYIDGDTAAETQINWDQERKPEPLGNLLQTSPTRPAQTIFLTGATGFVGSFLLAELLTQTQAQITCLIRAKDQTAAQQRLNTILAERLPNRNLDTSRITVLPGDLSQPMLGLDQPTFTGLTQTMDAVYHCGATVNFAKPYAMLKAANVETMRWIIQLSARAKTKPLHHISSLAFLPPDPNANGPRRESDPIGQTPAIDNGYLQTKWVADHLAQSAANAGLPVTIYRFGLVSGDTTTGISNLDDAFAQQIAELVKAGSLPEQGFLQNMIPVDYLTAAMVHLSQKEASQGKIYHLYNPKEAEWPDLVSLMSADYNLQTKPADHPGPTPTMADLFDNRNARADLNDWKRGCPKIDATLLKAYLTYFKTKGII